jgi:hypothetical protein
VISSRPMSSCDQGHRLQVSQCSNNGSNSLFSFPLVFIYHFLLRNCSISLRSTWDSEVDLEEDIGYDDFPRTNELLINLNLFLEGKFNAYRGTGILTLKIKSVTDELL